MKLYIKKPFPLNNSSSTSDSVLSPAKASSFEAQNEFQASQNITCYVLMNGKYCREIRMIFVWNV